MNRSPIHVLFLLTLSITACCQTSQLLPVGALGKEPKTGDAYRSFADQLKNKRIVFLGDLIHGEANIDCLRGVIIRYLIEKEGFNALAFESGFYDLIVANEKFKNGEDIRSLLHESIYSVWGGASLQPLVQALGDNRKKIRHFGLHFNVNNF